MKDIEYKCPACGKDVELKGTELMRDIISHMHLCNIYKCSHCDCIFLITNNVENL